MQNVQSIVLIWTGAYREIFKSALVYQIKQMRVF